MYPKIRTIATAIAGLTAAATPLMPTATAEAASCGYSMRTRWNVPEGALVANRADGPLRSLMDAINEWNTHVALSHGTEGWVTHSAPGRVRTNGGSTKLNTPINRDWIENAEWGPSQVTLAAMFNYYFGFKVSKIQGQIQTTWKFGDLAEDKAFAPDTVRTRGNGNDRAIVVSGPGPKWGSSSLISQEWYSGNNPDGDAMATSPWGALEHVPGGSNRGQRIAQWLWNDIPYTTVTSNDQQIYDLRDSNGNNLNYRWYDLMGLGFANEGSLDGGAVCSVFQSYASYKAGSGYVSSHEYDHDLTVRAINALWNKIKNDCENNMHWFDSIIVGVSGSNTCEKAANQMVNAFTARSSVPDADVWKAVRDREFTRARSISADCIAGWGCFSSGGGASAWAWDGARAVQWSGEGKVYGCWE